MNARKMNRRSALGIVGGGTALLLSACATAPGRVEVAHSRGRSGAHARQQERRCFADVRAAQWRSTRRISPVLAQSTRTVICVSVQSRPRPGTRSHPKPAASSTPSPAAERQSRPRPTTRTRPGRKSTPAQRHRQVHDPPSRDYRPSWRRSWRAATCRTSCCSTTGCTAATCAEPGAFLEHSMADLTPYLGGDAVKDYPFLAAIPTFAWKNSGCVYNGKLYMWPLERYLPGQHASSGTSTSGTRRSARLPAQERRRLQTHAAAAHQSARRPLRHRRIGGVVSGGALGIRHPGCSRRCSARRTTGAWTAANWSKTSKPGVQGIDRLRARPGGLGCFLSGRADQPADRRTQIPRPAKRDDVASFGGDLEHAMDAALKRTNRRSTACRGAVRRPRRQPSPCIISARASSSRPA